MKVLITGAGLIGCHLAGRLMDAGDQAVLFDLAPNREYIGKIAGPDRAEIVAADMRDLPALIGALKRYGVDTVVHTAGLIGKRVAENTYTGSTNNILGTIHVLEAARLLGLKRVVYVSTFGVYDRPRISDTVIRETAATGGHNLYTVTKLCSEHLVGAYAFHHNLDTVMIRPAGVFGRGHYVGGSTVGMIMRDLALSIIRGEAFKIDRGTYFANEYVYAKDVAQALELACRASNDKLKQRVYNAGTGAVTTPDDFAALAREISPNIEVQVVGQESGGHGRSLPMDLSRSQSELGYVPKYPMK
ncbi:MAG: NAD-dependent epimerase/dehydratase family protein, partial [Candidatus Binatia bacterium]